MPAPRDPSAPAAISRRDPVGAPGPVEVHVGRVEPPPHGRYREHVTLPRQRLEAPLGMAIADRFLADSFAALAGPPFFPPRRPSATAAGFSPRQDRASGSSLVACSMMAAAKAFRSRGLQDRFGIPPTVASRVSGRRPLRSIVCGCRPSARCDVCWRICPRTWPRPHRLRWQGWRRPLPQCTPEPRRAAFRARQQTGPPRRARYPESN
jgi:hypothetical protein